MQDSTNPWPAALARWISECRAIRDRAEAVTRSIHERAWRLAASVGIPRDGCCLHNASIDDAMTGWCKGNPHRLKVAKLAAAILCDWTAARIADALNSRAWDRHLHPLGGPRSREIARYQINRRLLFSVTRNAK